ncbi:PLDc N-terminal domain-containing protein [Sporosarcina sp. Marseille-Q4063]|uniref:PLDc N-terminal domain-containing protein n=1 Tax=Sporosarcina sp. Marseille-Q4063 TaxID=2810514 RepID=UPI001BB0197A|nr:PLDc N-terminal domain-containing protein [Sporosarcina sp. Marseille-Q4063]QUW20819.1 PLDc N-terminal domain-containing protein [Sporosarcina sp. Marseille-Q4063]
MSELVDVPWNLILPILVLQVILQVIALIDVIRNKRTNGPYMMWIFIIILGNIIGSIIYFVFGRKND